MPLGGHFSTPHGHGYEVQPPTIFFSTVATFYLGPGLARQAESRIREITTLRPAGAPEPSPSPIRSPRTPSLPIREAMIMNGEESERPPRKRRCHPGGGSAERRPLRLKCARKEGGAKEEQGLPPPGRKVGPTGRDRWRLQTTLRPGEDPSRPGHPPPPPPPPPSPKRPSRKEMLASGRRHF